MKQTDNLQVEGKQLSLETGKRSTEEGRGTYPAPHWQEAVFVNFLHSHLAHNLRGGNFIASSML